jgi:hypothetical protein
MNAIYNLLGRKAYDDKMLHTIPPAKVISREQYLIAQARGKTVLDIGASGPMHAAIKQAAKVCYGIDINPPPRPEYYKMDIDTAHGLPVLPFLELVIAGEVIEHLDNAGHFLDLLKCYDCPVILTTPNFASLASQRSIVGGVEMVNPGHVCYYSYWTFTTLAKKHGWEIAEWYWYNGKPLTAEGMIFVMRSV